MPDPVVSIILSHSLIIPKSEPESPLNPTTVHFLSPQGPGTSFRLDLWVVTVSGTNQGESQSSALCREHPYLTPRLLGLLHFY